MNVQLTTATKTAPEPTRAFKIGLIVGSSVLLLGLSASAVFAGQPTRQPLQLPDVIEIPAGGACDFPVRLDILINGEVNTTFERGEETWIRTTGRLIIGVTNEWNDHSMVVNISGPGLTIVHADGSATVYFYGRSLPLAENGFYVSSGPVVQEIAADGSVRTSVPLGFAQDLCAAVG
jgi:hypothetical protein